MIQWLKDLFRELFVWEPIPVEPPEAPVVPQEPITPIDPHMDTKTPVSMPPDPDAVMYPWDTPQHNYHNVRVLCDKAGLTLDEKNLLCSVVYQESEFYNYYSSGMPVENLNLNKDGSLSSTDFGILQINDFFHIGVGKDFPSVDFVLANPDKVVLWFIGMYQHGQLYQWSSYKTGQNRQWLLPTSPMWSLAI